MSTSDRDRLWQDLIVDVKNRRATFRGKPITISPTTPFPFRMLACLRDASGCLVSKDTLIEQIWENEGSESYYKLRKSLDRALKPHGLALNMPDRQGMSIELLYEPEGNAAKNDPVVEVDCPSRIVAYGTWEPSEETMSKAERSIRIIDSFYSEYWNLDLCVGRAIKRKQKNTKLASENHVLEISIYMTSPDTVFGVQRGREIARLAEDNVTCIKLMTDKISKDEIDEFKTEFKSFIKGLSLIPKAHPKKVTLDIHEYFSMPSTRLLVVDDRHFFFGFFPLWEHNPHYFCLYLEDNNLRGADQEVLTKLRGQIENVNSISNPVYSSPRTQSKIK